jgi:rare lipoprotein A
MKNKTSIIIRPASVLLIAFLLLLGPLSAGVVAPSGSHFSTSEDKTLYGLASYYAQKFHGRKTANGEIFDHSKMTAACNVLPLGTWLKVTNLKNKRSIVVKTNDRLHPKTRRIIDLSYEGAEKLGYIKSGLTRVKIEIIRK